MSRFWIPLTLVLVVPSCDGDSGEAPPPSPTPPAEQSPAAEQTQPTQPPMGARRGRPGGPMHYDASQETTVEGTVESVETMAASGRRGGGTHVQLKTSEGVIEVRLGPSQYLDQIGLQLDKGDAITVEGSSTDGTMTARTLSRGDQTWTLRDPSGMPKWRGRGGPRIQ